MDRIPNAIVPRTPTRGRNLRPLAVFPIIIACLAVSPALAQEALTEQDIIRLALARAPASGIADATTGFADARERTAGLLPNPLIDWEREALVSGENSSQDVFRATLPIDLARPLSARSLAASEGAWMRAEASTMRTGAVLEAVLAYYDVVVAKRRMTLLEETVSAFDEAARVLARREEAGTASGYESARLVIASELARSRLAEARGASRSAIGRLAALVGVDPANVRVAPSLALSELPAEAELAQRATRTEVFVHSRASAHSAAEAEERASWTWVPTLAVSAGPTVVRDLDRRYGYVVGLSLGIPIFDHGQALREEARAQQVLSVARYEALTRILLGELSAGYATYVSAREELERFEAATAGQVEIMLRAAQSGYLEGRHTIAELLDAQRVLTEVADHGLELEAAAKRAEATVRAAAGELR